MKKAKAMLATAMIAVGAALCAAIALVGGLIAGCASMPEVDNSVAADFKLERYLGEWYEIARFDHAFERGVEEAKATYTLKPDGDVEVLNSGVKDGQPKTAKGVAKATDTPGFFRVTFFWPFYGDYRVLMVDKTYSYALVGSGDAGYLWILSRSPRIGAKARETLLAEAKRRGYDTAKLLWIRQK